MTVVVRKFPATAAHCGHAEAATRKSSIGLGFGKVRPADEIAILIRGTAHLEEDLNRGRDEGGVPDTFVADLFSSFLDKDSRHIITLEDVIHRVDNPSVKRRVRPCWSLDHGVVWPIFAGETAADALQALSVLRGGPLLYGFHRLTTSWRPPDDGATLSPSDLMELRASLVGVMIDAYDSDGFVLWTRAGEMVSG